MGTPSSIIWQVLRKLCAKFDTFVTSVTIRPIFCTKRPDYMLTLQLKSLTGSILGLYLNKELFFFSKNIHLVFHFSGHLLESRGLRL